MYCVQCPLPTSVEEVASVFEAENEASLVVKCVLLMCRYVVMI
jgi:hypothetical protein